MRTALDVGVPKLYHYSDFKPEYLKDTLTKNRVHFSEPARFNDPWDCSPKYVIDQVITSDCVNAWSEFLLKDAAQVLPPEQLEKLRQLSLMEHIAFLEDTVKSTTKHSKQITTSRWRIYCLTPDPASILMWAHYANSHTGLCLEFDARIAPIANAYQVAYAEKRPLIRWPTLSDPIRLTETMLLTKSRDWSYEDEYRILCRNGDLDKGPAKTLCKTIGDYLELPPDAVSRVIVGNRGDTAAVKKLVEECRPGLAVHQAKLAEDDFRVIIPSEFSPG